TDHVIMRANETPPPNPVDVTGIISILPQLTPFAGVAVTATNHDDIKTVGISGGASGSVAVNVGGAVTVLTAHTNAWIGNFVTVTVVNADVNINPSVRVAASSDFYQLGIAGALAISGGVSVAP